MPACKYRPCNWCFKEDPNSRELRQQNRLTGLAYIRVICPDCYSRVFKHVPEGAVAAGAPLTGNRFYQ